MAFTRSTLKAMGFTDDQVQSLIDLHTEVTDNLKAEIKKYKEDAEKLPDVQRQLEEANSKISAAEKDDYKGKYESEKAAHDKLKEDIKAKETTAKKSTAFKAYLKEKGYSDNAITKITKYGGYVDGIELDDEGKIKDSDKLLTSIEGEWGEYKPTTTKVTHTPNVPNQTQQSQPKSEIAARFQKLSAKYDYDHYGIKPESKSDGGTTTVKEE